MADEKLCPSCDLDAATVVGSPVPASGMSTVRTGESDDEPEQLRRGSVNKATGRIRETTRVRLMGRPPLYAAP